MALKETFTLSSGQEVELRMPNMYEILSRIGQVPNAQMASVLRLLEGSGALSEQGLLQRFAALKEYFLGLYEVAALCIASPRLVLAGDPGEGELGPGDLTFGDVWAIYNRFFFKAPSTQSSRDELQLVAAILAGSADAQGPAPAAPAGDDL